MEEIEDSIDVSTIIEEYMLCGNSTFPKINKIRELFKDVEYDESINTLILTNIRANINLLHFNLEFVNPDSRGTEFFYSVRFHNHSRDYHDKDIPIFFKTLRDVNNFMYGVEQSRLREISK